MGGKNEKKKFWKRRLEMLARRGIVEQDGFPRMFLVRNIEVMENQ